MEQLSTRPSLSKIIMGTFLGHLVAGMYGCFLGLWWMYSIACRYYTTVPFRSSTWFLWHRYPNTPIEPYVGVITCTLGSILEYFGGLKPDGFVWTNAQHIVMYLSMVVLGVTQLLRWYKKWVPAGFDYCFLMLANFIIGFQLYYHLHGRSSVDGMLHTQIVAITVFEFFSILLEFLYMDCVAIAMIRSMLQVLFGINFLHTGFILYPPWIYSITDSTVNQYMDLNSHSSMVKVNVLFVFEICLCSVLALVCFGVMHARCSKAKIHSQESKLP